MLENERATRYTTRMKLATNKKAFADFELLEQFEAGIVLHGHEVKSAKDGLINLKGAYVALTSGEVFLWGAHIALYQKASHNAEHDPYRTRKLLLNKKEIARLVHTKQIKGLTIIPLCVYTKGSVIKIQIAIARGRAQHDKRLAIKKRELDREVRRNLL